MEDKSKLGSLYGSVIENMRCKEYYFDQICIRLQDWAMADRLECGSDYSRKANDSATFNDIQSIVRDYYRSQSGGCPYAE